MEAKIDHMGFFLILGAALLTFIVVGPLWNMTLGTYVPALKA
jgi:hypothetical protein